MKEKYALMQELFKKDEELKGDNVLSLIGQGNYAGMNNPMRSTMNTKHQTQHLTIDNPEFPFIFDGKENLIGANSSFYKKTDMDYEVIKVIKKYDELLKGKCYFALYFLYNKEADAYHVIERKECENLTENFGFNYRNDFLDQARVGDVIPKDTVVYTTTSYDENMNVSTGVNGLMLYGVHPSVQDDAIVVSESFSKRMISNQIISKTIPVNENTIFINLYGDDENYQGLPNIGDTIKDGILAATRQVRDTRMFSDMRDSSLSTANFASDQIYYCETGNDPADYSEVIDINIYCNNPNLKLNKINKQLIRYRNDLKFYYSEIYRTTIKIKNSSPKYIDPEILHWLRRAKEYLDEEAMWDFNDNIFSNLMVQLLLRRRSKMLVGQKITGLHGNKCVISRIIPDEEMPFITTASYTDEHGRVQPKGQRKHVELISNPLAIINRTIPMALFEASLTFILSRVREHMAKMDSAETAIEFMFDILRKINKKYAKDVEKLYKSLSPREKTEFLQDSINKWMGVRKDAFDPEVKLRDAILEVYKDYGKIIKPYKLFVPKPKWGRDIYVGDYHIGYQYIMLLKQSGERGFSVRSAGAISDESLPEKSNENKIGKLWHSETPIRFGEYETPNFLIITAPEDYALITALYRSSIDGRRFLYEAIQSEDGNYEIPDNFTSRSAEILKVYLKSLGVRMETVEGENNYIGEKEDKENIIPYIFRNSVIFATPNEMYYVLKLAETYRYVIRDNPSTIRDFDETWDQVLQNLPFKKKRLTDNIVNLFKNNLEVLSNGGYA